MTDKLALFKGLGQVMTKSNSDGHLKALGIEVVKVEVGKVVMKLTYHNDLVASPETGIIAGGAITALLDTGSGFVSMTTLEPMGITATIDLRVDYLRAPEVNKPIYAEVEVLRTTQFVVFTRGVAWQDKDKPLAYSMGNFVNNPMDENTKEMLTRASRKVELMPPRDNNYDKVQLVSEQISIAKLNKAREKSDANLLINFIPYAKLLDLQRIPSVNTGKWLYMMPPAQKLVGNHMLQALHGGAIAGFVETSALLHLIMKMTVEHIPKVVDINIDYIRPAFLKKSFCRCKIIRFGRRLVSVEVTCWQESHLQVIAKARLQFVVDKDIPLEKGNLI